MLVRMDVAQRPLARRLIVCASLWAGNALWITIAAAQDAVPATRPAATRASTTTKPASAPATRSAGMLLKFMLPDGSPAADADVYTCRQANRYIPLCFKDNAPDMEMRVGSLRHDRTDPAGQVQLYPPDEDDYSVCVVAPEGHIELAADDVEPGDRFSLQRWARLEGVLVRGDTPRADVPISLDIILRSFTREILFSYSTKTDAQGRFRFERVIPGGGRNLLGRGLLLPYSRKNGLMFRDYEVLDPPLAPGRTARLLLGARGRAVTGTIRVPGDQKYEMAEVIDPPQLIRVVDPEADDDEQPVLGTLSAASQSSSRATTSAPAGAARFIEPQPDHFQAALLSDGRVRFEDVPGGKWRLQMRLKRPGGRELLAVFDRTFDVPAIESGRQSEPYDLGELKVRLVREDDEGDEAGGG